MIWYYSSTPPVTLTNAVNYLKKRHRAISYLLLKDIFPQNAVDLGMVRKGGILHRYFRNQEKRLYRISDFIGTMSPANVKYIISNNHHINPDKVEICPTSIDPTLNYLDDNQKMQIRAQYNIPVNKVVFIYGGNFGKPQGLDFMLEVLKSNIGKNELYFVIVGTGTESPKIKSWFEKNRPSNALLISGLPKDEYDKLVQSCDVGMIFLDRRFTIPNYPSRLLSYLVFRMPIVAATDTSSDIGDIALKNGYGYWSLSGDLESINGHIARLTNSHNLIKDMGANGYRFLMDNYTVDTSYEIIMRHFTKNN